MLFCVCRPVMLRKFDSGVRVIQNKSHSDEEVLFSLIFTSYSLILNVLVILRLDSPFFFPLFLGVELAGIHYPRKKKKKKWGMDMHVDFLVFHV